MKKNKGLTLTRREFAHRAAMLSATATLVPAGVMLQTPTSAPVPVQMPENFPKLSTEGQAEAEARFQTVLSRYGSRLSDEEKSTAKMLCIFMQPSLEHVRAYPLENGDVPAVFLKPLIEREKKSQGAPAAPSAA